MIPVFIEHVYILQLLLWWENDKEDVISLQKHIIFWKILQTFTPHCNTISMGPF